MSSQNEDRKDSADDNAPAYQEPRLFPLGAAVDLIQGGDGSYGDNNGEGWYEVASPQSRPKPR